MRARLIYTICGCVCLMGIAQCGGAPSESSVEIDAAPSLGQHSSEVLNDDLGLTQKELDDLSKQGVIK